MATRRITVDYMARVEGEGSLDLHITDGRVIAARLGIFEPPRFFEAFLRGRGFAETPDIVARICGICPVAYQMSAVHALEDAFGVRVEGQLRALRRLIYCGEWIESHALHVVMLHAPDFLGYPNAIRMAAEHGDRVRGALALKKAGNAVIRLLGRREIHPVKIRVGGFYRVPTRAELAPLAGKFFPSRSSSGTTSSSHCAIRTNIPSTKGGWFPVAASTSTLPTTRQNSRSARCPIRRRCIRC